MRCVACEHDRTVWNAREFLEGLEEMTLRICLCGYACYRALLRYVFCGTEMKNLFQVRMHERKNTAGQTAEKPLLEVSYKCRACQWPKQLQNNVRDIYELSLPWRCLISLIKVLGVKTKYQKRCDCAFIPVLLTPSAVRFPSEGQDIPGRVLSAWRLAGNAFQVWKSSLWTLTCGKNRIYSAAFDMRYERNAFINRRFRKGHVKQTRNSRFAEHRAEFEVINKRIL